MIQRHPRVLDCAELDWTDGTPVSRGCGDVYFSRADGVRESQFIFLEGNHLPQRLPSERGAFCIGETGFGTGLNFLLARRLFLDAAPGSAQLHFVSFEQAPLKADDRECFARMLEARGERGLAGDARRLSSLFPPPVAGWHRLVLDEGRVRLSLWLGDAAAGLEDWRRVGGMTVDAWFLDGFAPPLNPELWEYALARRLAAHSHAGTTVTTFSVARSVRDALGGAGFELEKVPGPPGKREMLRGRASVDWPRHEAVVDCTKVTVAGAGLAGASVARACAERGLAVRVLDPAGAATGASGNRYAVLHPRLPLDDGPRAALLLAAETFTRVWLERDGWRHAFRPRSVLQYPEARRRERLAKVRERFGELDGHLRWHGGDVLCLEWPRAGHADLPALVAALLDHDAIEVERGALAPQRTADARPSPVVIAAGGACNGLLNQPIGLGRVRGQLTRVRSAAAPGEPILTGRGHAIPLADGWSIGSSYVHLPNLPAQDDMRPTTAERTANLGRLTAWAELRAFAAGAEAVADWVGIRATTPDRAPVVGPLAPGLWLNTGHSSSGLLTCPLAAEAIAAALCGEPPVFDAELTALLAPTRLI